MSWLLENWFGSKESLEQVREDIHEHLHKESYLGVSGINNPEQSSNRVPTKDLFLTLHGAWESNLEEVELELLQYIHDELPSLVRDEVGIYPFFANTTADGYLVLSFIRNATERDVLINRLPLSLVTPEGKVVAKKTFDMIPFGAVADFSSRPCEFMFHWTDFLEMPEQDVPLHLIYEAPAKVSVTSAVEEKAADGLNGEETAKYSALVAGYPYILEGEVDLQVIDITAANEGGLKVVVLFRNGLDKNLEFTEVPIIIRNKKGEELGRIHYGLKNMKVEANSNKLWGFHVPASSLKVAEVDPTDCTVFIPVAKRSNSDSDQPIMDLGPKGIVQ